MERTVSLSKPPRPPATPASPLAVAAAAAAVAGSGEPQRRQLRLTNLDGPEGAAAVEAVRAALTASRLAAIAGNDSPATPYFTRTMSESSDDLFEISISRDEVWDAIRFQEDGFSGSFSVGELFPFAGGELQVFDREGIVNRVGEGMEEGGGWDGSDDDDEDLKARLRGEYPESSGPISPRDKAALTTLSKCFPAIKHSVIEGRIQKNKGGFKSLKRQSSASSFTSELSFGQTLGSPINGIVEKPLALKDVERGEGGGDGRGGRKVALQLGVTGPLGVRGRGSGFPKGRCVGGRRPSTFQERLPEHFGVSDFMLGLAIFMAMSCLCMAVAEIVLEILIRIEIIPLIPFRENFFVLTLLLALVAYHALLGIRRCRFEAAKNALQIAWLMDVALLIENILFINSEQSDHRLIPFVRYPYVGLTFVNFSITTYLYIRLNVGCKSGGGGQGQGHGDGIVCGRAGGGVPVAMAGGGGRSLFLGSIDEKRWAKERERCRDMVVA